MIKYLDKMISISERLEAKKSKRLEKIYALLLLFVTMCLNEEKPSRIVKIECFPINYKDADQLINSFCKVVGLHSYEIIKKTREREIVSQRQRLQTLLCYNTRLSLAGIGQITGGKDHATVLHSKRVVRNMCDTDKRYRDEFYSIVRVLGLTYN